MDRSSIRDTEDKGSGIVKGRARSSNDLSKGAKSRIYQAKVIYFFEISEIVGEFKEVRGLNDPSA